ncbi:MAG: SusF/SusE family outer membrane protein, partial [Phocaeicola sp.]
WNIPVGDEETYTFEARVTAVVSDPSVETQISNVVVFDVQPYKYRTLKLYLIGDATPGGWNIEQATLMTMDAENKDVFTWEGTLLKNGFRFICQNTSGTWWPGYVKDSDNEGKAKYFATEPAGEDDVKFMINAPGVYRVTINTSTLDVVIDPIDVEEPEPELYLIGDATTGGWDVPQATKMNYIESAQAFEWEGALKAGKFRFVCQNISGMFWPGYAKDANDDNKMVYFETAPSSEQDISFDIDKPGIYKITANTSSLDVNIQPISVQEPAPELYLIGNATPGGWEIMNATEMSYNEADKTFEWNGNLISGELRFICQRIPGTWWPGYVKDPVNEGKAKYFDAQPADGEDIKFTISDAGKYYVILNTETLEVVIRKQDDVTVLYDNVWMIGDATPIGWSWKDMVEMNQSEQNGNIFTWTGHLNAGEIKFSLDGPTANAFSGYLVYATKQDASIFNDTDIDIRNSGEDYKWKLSELEAGTYTITINFNTNKISFEKQN